MSEEEKKAIDILNNVVADEVVGTYCLEIQKTTNCVENCKDDNCFIIKAIDTVTNLIEKLQKEIEGNKQMIDELNFRYNIEHSKNLSKKELIEQQQKEIEELKGYTKVIGRVGGRTSE